MWNLWNPIENKFTWVIRNFSSLKSKKIYSDEFVLDGCTWRLLAFPKGNGFDEEFSLYLDVAGGEFLPSGWRRHARMMFTIVNQVSEELSVTKDALHFFNAKESDFGFKAMMPLKKIHDKDGGFLVNGKLKIVVGVQVLGVTGERDMPDASEDEAAESSDDDESDEEVSSVMENINGFLVLPSQVETVRRIFEKHPETTTDFRPKNQHLRSSCISVLLALIETLCQSTQELSKGDLEDADSAFGYLVSTGLNLDWLEDKLVEVTGKKESVEAGETRMQKIEKELKELRQKCSNLEFKLEEEKANVALARAPLSFDDVV